MSHSHFYPIGTAGQAWGAAELEQWRARQVRQRSYANDVLAAIEHLRDSFDVSSYGEVVYGDESFPLMDIRSRHWQAGLPGVLVTGGVHGYETSGVHGALRVLQELAPSFAGRVNLLVAPCVSPWAYERIQRWNFDAIDPNRSFREASPAQESAALMRLVAPLRGQFVAHIAPADAHGGIIGSPLVTHGVIHYAMKELGLCAGISGARYTSTTEVYPGGARAAPEQCIAAQAAAVGAVLRFVN